MLGNSRLGITGIVGILALSSWGCSEGDNEAVEQRPITAAEATATTNERVDTVLSGLASTLGQIDTTDSTTIATDAVNEALDSAACGETSSDSVTDTAGNTVDSIPDETTTQISDWLVQLRDEAKEHIFREELVESTDGNVVTYKIDPAQACETDTTCIDKLTQNPLRFAVTANSDDTFNVAMLVGQDRHSPASAILSEDKIVIRGNLSEAMASLRLFMSTEDQADLPDKLLGSVEWSIEKRADGEFVFAFSLLEKFELLTGQTKGKPIAVTVQPRSPMSQITVNSNTNTIGFQENIGTVDVSVAGTAVCDDMDCDTKEQAGAFGLHLAGLTGGFTVAAQAEDLTFSDIGFGGDSSYLALNDERLATVDLNPESGRKLSMSFRKTADGTLVTFEPALDLKIALAMNHLSESMRIDMPDWLFDEVFNVTLGDAPKPSILIPAARCNADGTTSVKQQLKVVTGLLKLNSTSLASPVEVKAGMCLLPNDNSPDDAHPMTLVSSGICE